MIDLYGLAATAAANLLYQEEQIAHNYRSMGGVPFVDPNSDVYDLPADAVREVRAPKLIGVDLADGPDNTVYFVPPVEWSLGRVECDSDGGECD